MFLVVCLLHAGHYLASLFLVLGTTVAEGSGEVHVVMHSSIKTTRSGPVDSRINAFHISVHGAVNMIHTLAHQALIATTDREFVSYVVKAPVVLYVNASGVPSDVAKRFTICNAALGSEFTLSKMNTFTPIIHVTASLIFTHQDTVSCAHSLIPRSVVFIVFSFDHHFFILFGLQIV